MVYTTVNHLITYPSGNRTILFWATSQGFGAWNNPILDEARSGKTLRITYRGIDCADR